MISEDAPSRCIQRILRRGTISIDFDPRGQGGRPYYLLGDRSFRRVNIDSESFKNSELSHVRGCRFGSFRARKIDIRDDDINSRFPMHSFVVEPSLISAVPDGREKINNTSLDHNLTLVRPIPVTDVPDLFKGAEMKVGSEEICEPSPEVEGKRTMAENMKGGFHMLVT